MIKDYVCVDIETTGIRPKWDRIIEIGAVKVRDGKEVDRFSQLIYPGIHIPPRITELTGITDEMLGENRPFIRYFPGLWNLREMIFYWDIIFGLITVF